MRIQFIDKVERAQDVWEFRFVPESPVEYTPGQYSHLILGALPRERARAFSWVSHPSEPQLRFITRLETPASAYKRFLFALQPGDACVIDEPMGDAILPRLTTVPLLFVAQGIALASYLSILKECESSALSHGCERAELSHRQIVLMWVRRSEDNPLEKLIPGEIPHLTRVDVLYPEHLTPDMVLSHVTSQSLIYLSGSQSFVETLGSDLESAGILRERIIYDYYDGYSEL